MGNIKERFFLNPIFWVFAPCILYWTYLVVTSQMVISADASDYESLGKLFLEKGWAGYLSTGPHREPFYPLLIGLSMRIGALFSLSYQSIQMILQLFILFITQLMMVYILRLLNINKWITAGTVLYLGISPAIVNSALTLLSEIPTYPLVLGSILILYKSWLEFSERRSIRIVLLAIAGGATFALLTFTKGIFEMLTPLFIVFFLLSTLLSRNRKLVSNAFIYYVLVLTVFFVFVTGYKLSNKILNGRFAVSDLNHRGAIMLYASAVQRTEPLTREKFLAALAYIVGRRACEVFFGEEKCFFWCWLRGGHLGYALFPKLEQSGISREAADKKVTSLAIETVLKNPAQYALFWFMEGFKMFFWETTRMGYVRYSQGLTKLFAWLPIRNCLRPLLFSLTFVPFVYSVGILLRKRRDLFKPQENTLIIIFSSVLLIVVFSGVYALCTILDRFTLPIVPLYFILLAFFVQIVFSQHIKGRKAGSS